MNKLEAAVKNDEAKAEFARERSRSRTDSAADQTPATLTNGPSSPYKKANKNANSLKVRAPSEAALRHTTPSGKALGCINATKHTKWPVTQDRRQRRRAIGDGGDARMTGATMTMTTMATTAAPA